MDLIQEYWPTILEIGGSILALIGGVIFFSLNIYFRDCKNLALMKEYISKHDSLHGFYIPRMSFIGVNAFIYAFKSISNYDHKFTKHRKFKSQLELISGYRKLYVTIAPIILLLVLVAFGFNCWIIANKI